MTADRLLLDSHKLMLHPRRVAAFLAGRREGPIYVELSLTNRCNFACRFCALDYCRDTPTDLPRKRVLDLLPELVRAGVGSVCLAGEGEPTLHPAICEVVSHGYRCGLDMALVTNGTGLEAPALREALCEAAAWVKVSLNAVRPGTYAALHGAPGAAPQPVLDGITALVTERERTRSRLIIGVQAVLVPENADELVELARAARACGADYFVVKSYLHNPHQRAQTYCGLDYQSLQQLAPAVLAETTPTFTVSFRAAPPPPRTYGGCPGACFAAFIHADGRVYTCPTHGGEPEHCYGDISTASFAEVWDGARCRAVQQRVSGSLHGCASGCRLHHINTYLWQLLRPGPHANFI